MQDEALQLELMTSPEVAEAIRSGTRSIVVPCGAIEQHGAHLPLSVDADHARRLGAMVAKRIGKCLVAPVIKTGCSSHHMKFAGTISLRDETFEALLRDYCASLATHGFTRIFIFSAHVGNCPVLKKILSALRDAVPAGCKVNAFVDSSLWLQTWRSSVEAAGGDAARVGGHADIAETSLMLILRRDRVLLEKAAQGHIGLLDEEKLNLMWREGIGGISPSGILGDARGAESKIGERCLNDMADMLAGFFDDTKSAAS
jgi:creatinine amidohydrolase